MNAPTLRPEPLDLDIFRAMYGSNTGALAGMDPRLNATRIARRLRVGRARVAARLKAWSDSGFLSRLDVWLNPALFAHYGGFYNVRVTDPHVKPSVIARLGLVEGAVSSMEFLGEWVTFGVVVPEPAAFERLRKLVEGFTGVRSVEPVMPWPAVAPKRALTPLDLRVVRALRERPTASLTEIARRVGVSTRTMTRRYAELVGDWATWFVPVFDFRAISDPIVSVLVTLAPGASATALARRVRARYPLTEVVGGIEEGPPAILSFFAILPSAAHLEELSRLIAGQEGVADVETNVMVRMHTFPGWFDRQLDSLERQVVARAP